MAPAHNDHADTRRTLNRTAAWMVTAALLLAGCGERADVNVTDQSPTALPSAPKPVMPTKLPQKPQTELAKMFTAAAVMVLSAKRPEELERIKPLKNVSLSRQPNGLKMTATTRDPSVLLPEFRGENAIIQLVMDSPADTIVEIFYLLPGQNTYGGGHRIRQKIKAGRNVIYAQLPDQAWTGALRLDFGAVPGEYLLESFEVKTVSTAGAH